MNEENEENEEEKEFFIQKIIEFYNFFGFLKKIILIIFEENTAKNGSNVFCRQSKNSSFSKYKRPSGQDYNKIIICDDINELSNKCVYVMKRINCILKKYYSSVELKNIYISLSKDAKDITTEFEHLYKNLKINDTDDMFNKLRIYLSKITQEYSISSELEESSEDSDIQDYNKKNSNEIDELSKEFDEHLEKLLKLYLDESSFIGKKKLDIFLKEKRCKIFLLRNVFFKKISELEIEQKKIQYTYFINIIEHYFSEVETYLKNSKYNLEDPTPEYLDRNEKKIIKYKEEEQREEVNKSLVEEVEKYLKKKKTNNFTTSSDEDEDEDENTNTERPI